MKPMTSRLVCHADDCNNTRRRDQLMCRACWNQVPADLQRAVYAAYDPSAGYRQSPEWAAAAQRAIASLRPEQT